MKYKKATIPLIVISLAIFSFGCKKLNLLSEPKEETQEKIAEESSTNPSENGANSEDNVDKDNANKDKDDKNREIDESLVMNKNPEYERSTAPTTYHYALPKYDIVAFEFAIENNGSRWIDLPVTKITDFIFKTYKGSDRPVIWIDKCELLKIETEWFGEKKVMTTCTTGFELIVNNKIESVYGYSDGILYKVDRTKDAKDYEPEVVAKIPNGKEQILPIMAPTEYVHYTLYTPPEPIEFKQLSILQAVNELYESVLLPNTPPSKLNKFYIMYDGNTKYQGKDAYEFTLGFGYDIKDMFHFLRMGVTEDHQYYTYEVVPFDTNRSISVNLEPPVPTGYNRSYGKRISMVRKYYQDGLYSLEIPVPRYRTTQFLTPEIAAFGLVKLFDSALLNNTTFFNPQFVQKLQTTSDLFVTIYKDYTRFTPKMLRIIWTGVDNINDEETLVFNANNINMAVSQSGKLYTYVLKPVYGGKLKVTNQSPQLEKDYSRSAFDFKLEHRDLFMDNVFSIVSRNMRMDKNVHPLPFLTPEDSEPYLDALIDEYKGQSNNMPWRKNLYKNGEINGEKTYEFQIGQEFVYGDYLLRFEAAISESGKIYVYENGSPKLVRQVTFE